MAVGVCDLCGVSGNVEAMGRDAAGDPDSPDVCETCRGAGDAERESFEAIEDHLRANAFEFILLAYGREATCEEAPKSLVSIKSATASRRSSQVDAVVLCGDGRERRCRARSWSTPGSYWEPADSGEDFEWIEEAK
jgi:hypothetical protein